MEVRVLFLRFQRVQKRIDFRIFWIVFIDTFYGIHFVSSVIVFSLTAVKPISWHQTERIERVKPLASLSHYIQIIIWSKLKENFLIQLKYKSVYVKRFSTPISTMKLNLFSTRFLLFCFYFLFSKKEYRLAQQLLVAVKLINVLIVIQCSRWKFSTITIITPGGNHFCLMHFRILNTMENMNHALVQTKRSNIFE